MHDKRFTDSIPSNMLTLRVYLEVFRIVILFVFYLYLNVELVREML